MTTPTDTDLKMLRRALTDMCWLASFLTGPDASVSYDTEARLFILYTDAVPMPVSATGKTLGGAIYRMRRQLA